MALDSASSLCPETTRGVVYKITLPDGRAYIGKTERTARRRLRGHFRDKRKKFYEELKSFRPENCKLEILFHSTDADVLFEVERQMVAKYGTQDPAVGCNTGSGGEGHTSARAKQMYENPVCRANVTEANRTSGGIAPMDHTITVLADRNPRQPGGRRHLAFSLYQTGMSVAEFLEACRPHGLLGPANRSGRGSLAGSALRHDIKDGFIRIDPPIIEGGTR